MTGMAEKIRSHVVGGFFADKTTGALLFVEERKLFDRLLEELPVSPEHTLDNGSGAIFAYPADALRKKIIEAGHKSCLRCKVSEECGFVSESMWALGGYPFLFKIVRGDEVFHGGDHDAFAAEENRLRLEWLKAKQGEVGRVVDSYAGAVDAFLRGDKAGAVFEALKGTVGLIDKMGGGSSYADAAPTHLTGPLRELGLSWPCSPDDVRAAFKREALRRHPDRGGNDESLHRAVQARDALLGAL